MPRFLLNPCGTSGDVHPYIAVGRELLQRGHEVFVLTNPAFRGLAERESISFVPIGEPLDWKELRSDPRVHDPKKSWKAAMQWGATGTMRATFDAIRDLNRPGETVVAAPAWSLGARIARDALKVPLATCVLNPFLLRSAYQSPITSQLWMPDRMPRWMKRFQYWFVDQFFIEPLLGKEIRAFCDELQLPYAPRCMNGWWFSPDLVLGLFNQIYVPEQSDWPCRVEYVGHTVWDPSGDPEIQTRVEAFLDAGSPPVCFVPGSVGPGASSFYSVAIKACAQLKVRGLILDKAENAIADCLPETMHHAPYAPLRNVLPKCSAIVHSGCIGTAAQGLLAGIPHLIRPRVNDQPDMAQRLHRLGIARVLQNSEFNVQNVAIALHEILIDSKQKGRCREVQSIVAGDDAPKSIANALERLR
jgi:UDP:flavonoid glycosyltransferase YjiC (YdhE family)